MSAPSKFKAVTPVISTDAYAAGDAVGGRLEIPIISESHINAGALISVTVTAEFITAQPELDLVLFDKAFTATADNAAFDPSTADVQGSRLGVITIETYDWKVFAANQMATVSKMMPVQLNNSNGILYGQLVTRTVFTAGSTSDITVGTGLLRD